MQGDLLKNLGNNLSDRNSPQLSEDDQAVADGLIEFSVSEVSDLIKSTLEKNFCKIRVIGEISGLVIAKSGHVYFSLKDQNAVLSVVCWRGVYLDSKIQLEDGMEVICEGKISSYPSRSNYQLILNKITISGVGSLMKLFEERKLKLANLGLFDSENKKPIPKFPKTIGIITSRGGAVIRDIIHRIKAKFPLEIYLYDVSVQGNSASREVAHAIRVFNNLLRDKDAAAASAAVDSALRPAPPDLLIVARGGGSMEDLWCFNEEEVVHAIADCNIPIISAIGHETDFTLCDFAADLRAPTPTAAAEIATQHWFSAKDNIPHIFKQISTITNHKLQEIENRVMMNGKLLDTFSHNLSHIQREIEILWQRASDKILTKLEHRQLEVVKLQSNLEALSPNSILKRGYSIIMKNNKDYVTSSSQLTPQDEVSITLHDGTKKAIIS